MKARHLLPAFWLTALALAGAPLRVTTWDWQNGGGKSAPQVATALAPLQPDIILLQHVPGWQACQKLADALRPGTYHVLTCSAWNGKGGGQAAILSRFNAFISWSDPWPAASGPGGYCVAVIRCYGTNVGFVSAQAGPTSVSGIDDNFLANKIAALENWMANRPDAFVVAGNDNLPLLEQFGFENAAARPPAYIYDRNAPLAGPVHATTVASTKSAAASCVIDWNGPRYIPPPPAPEAQNEPPPSPIARIWVWIAGGVLTCLVLLIFASRMRRRAARRRRSRAVERYNPQDPDRPPYVHIETDGSARTQSQSGPRQIPEDVRQGVIAEISGWLKSKFVRRLVSDRESLIATQEAAKLKVLAVDQRLTKIEHQIGQRVEDYERRIDVLLQALVTAEEHNRELIRHQIAMLQSEMEKARRREQRHERKEF